MSMFTRPFRAATHYKLQSWVLILGFWLAGLAWSAETEVWVKIDTREQTLDVMHGNQLHRRFEAVALGRGGVGKDRRKGDGKTPLGEFQITRINHNSPFLLFFGLNFPLPEHAERALQAGKIDRTTYQKILDAHRRGDVPPQDTPLGGQIGIHGLGGASLKVHKRYNWTKGCVALTNPQIRALGQSIGVGTRVVIQ